MITRKKYFMLVHIAIILCLPFLVMLLWNNIVVDLFVIKTITYIQALGLLILCRILFGGFNFGKKNQPPFANAAFREKWFTMNTEEKEQFKAEWKKRKNNCE